MKKRVGNRMRIGIALGVAIGVGLSAAWASTEEANQLETDHLIIEWKDGVEHDAVERAKIEGERFYSILHDMLGYEPKSKTTIVLMGPSEQPDGSWGYPHVDFWGRIELFQFGPTSESYFSALAHEMVHVFRFDRRARANWFFEEGFAEFVALRADSSLRGFPWYDFPIVVASGQWIASDEDIPLSTLRDSHRALNLPCKAQSYTLRSSFFHYLGKEYGDSTLLDMANEERAGELSDYRRYFDKDFDALEAEWRESLLAEYEETEGVGELARRYREETPIQYMGVCKKGEKF